MTLACVDGGILPSTTVQLDAFWNLRLEHTQEVLHLGAVGQSAHTGDVFYVFCGQVARGADPDGRSTRWLEERPTFLKEILLPLPVVLLRRSPRGFHMLSKSDWDALLQEDDAILASAVCVAPAQVTVGAEAEEAASSVPVELSDDADSDVSDASPSDSSSSFDVTDEEEEAALEDELSEAGLLDEACAEA